ncbi:MAG TPA: lecithin retinol acyltransferase family protein [Candidatus Ozemobacteraceae bacterium]|nr:lecithin retinol acyltransferase family protein [Candidatus Ozemobacteraceae bacterium]
MKIQPGTVIYVFRSMTARLVETAIPRRSAALPTAKGVLSATIDLFFGESGPFPDLSKLVRLERYRHYGVYAGRGQVIHFTGDTPSAARIRLTSLTEFEKGTFLDGIATGGSGIHADERVEFPEGKAAAVRRARSLLGTDFGGYHLLRNNCEHFATWCACRRKISRQFLDKGIELVMPSEPPFGSPWSAIVRRFIME